MKHRIFNVVALDFEHLTNRQVYQMTADCLPFFQTFVQTHKEEAVHGKQLDILKEQLLVLEQQLHKSRKSQVSSMLKTADAERNKALDIIMSFIKVYGKFPDKGFQPAHEKLAQLLKQYQGIKREPYQLKSESFNHLLNALAGADYQPAIQKLELAPHIARLQIAQEDFDRIYQDRLAEKVARVIGKTEKCREKLLETFVLLVYYTALNGKLDPTKTHYLPLLDQINTVLTTYKQTLIKS